MTQLGIVLRVVIERFKSKPLKATYPAFTKILPKVLLVLELS